MYLLLSSRHSRISHAKVYMKKCTGVIVGWGCDVNIAKEKVKEAEKNCIVNSEGVSGRHKERN